MLNARREYLASCPIGRATLKDFKLLCQAILPGKAPILAHRDLRPESYKCKAAMSDATMPSGGPKGFSNDSWLKRTVRSRRPRMAIMISRGTRVKPPIFNSSLPKLHRTCLRYWYYQHVRTNAWCSACSFYHTPNQGRNRQARMQEEFWPKLIKLKIADMKYIWIPLCRCSSPK